MVEFSDEEGYGRFLDLHEHYNRYINIKGIERCDYLEFLTHFDKLFDINKDKKTASYKEYIMHLMDCKGVSAWVYGGLLCDLLKKPELGPHLYCARLEYLDLSEENP